jgi:hypothetical protein
VRDYLNIDTPYRVFSSTTDSALEKRAPPSLIAEGMKSEKHVFVLTVSPRQLFGGVAETFFKKRTSSGS